MNSTQLRDKLGAKQDELGKIFAEAKCDDGSIDFNKVTCLGDQVKGSIAVAEKVKQLNAEADDLAQQAETIEAAEQAAKGYQEREKQRNRVPLPGKGGSELQQIHAAKALGQATIESPEFKAWLKGGAGNGVTLQFENMLFSDALAKAMAFETIGAKTLMTTAAGFAPESVRAPGFVDAVTRPIQLLDIIPMSRTDQALYKYMEETTRTHAAAELAEGATYAESAFAFTEKSTPVQKIGDSIPVTDEQLEDVAFIETYLNGRLMFGVRQRLDSQCLIGSGTGANLRGLKNVVGIQTQAKGADPVPDAFFKAMVKVRVTGRSIPTHHLMHPTDWQNIRLLRTVDGVYIWGSPSEAGPERLWGLPVVQQDADAAGTGYVGAFTPDCVSLHEKRGIDVQVGYVGTQFAEGKRTIRADMRAALAWTRPVGFCSVTGL